MRGVQMTQSGEMPFLDHLEELRWRIIYSLLALIVGVAAAFGVLYKFDVVSVLAQPILPYLPNHKLIYTHPGEAFKIVLNASVAIGLFIALPIVLYQIWAFLSPALHRHEKRLVIPILAAAMFLFSSGVALSYFVVLPLAIPWLMGWQSAGLQPMITASEYFDFAVTMSLSFGVCFELPIVILGLAALGVVTPAILNKYRRHAIVGCVVIGAFLTPGDLVWTTIAMAIPLYFLYEVSVVLSYAVERRRKRAAAAEAAEDAAAGEGAPA